MVELYKMKEDLISNIRARGYTSPTAIQMQAIPLMMNRREILACAPTGSGKTAAFLVPIIHCLDTPQKKGFRAVIVAPTRELANQIHRECVKLSEGRGLRCHVIENVSKAIQKFGPKSSQRFGTSLNVKILLTLQCLLSLTLIDILVTTPNRLVHLLEQEPPGISLKK